MAASAGHRHPNCNILNLSYEKKEDSTLIVLVNSVRFHISVSSKDLQEESGPGAKLAREYRDLLAIVKAADDDFTKPCSKENLRTRKASKQSDSHDSGHGTGEEDEAATSDGDSAVDVNGSEDKTSALMQEAQGDPQGALSEWILRPFGTIFEEQAPASERHENQTLREWYEGTSFFFSLSIKDGELVATKEETSPALENKIAGIIPRMYAPKWMRELEIPWYASKDLTVLRESDEIPPYHASQVRIGDETYFLKLVDPTQPQPARREIDLLKKIETAGLHEQFRVPVLKGLVGFEDSNTEMMGFLESEIEDPTPLTKLLDSEVPQEKRDAWAEESQRIVDILHDHKIIWGDAKADNFMVDKHDNLWIIDFGGSYTDGWIDPELMETKEGDEMGLERIVNALHDPDANTWDPTQDHNLLQSGVNSSSAPKRKVGKLNEESVRHDDEQSDDNDDNDNDQAPARKRARVGRRRSRNSQRASAKSLTDDEDVEGGEEQDYVQDEIDTGGTVENELADEDGDDNEQFCFCEKPSSGDMVACDNDDCSRQWFHFECLGLKEAPKAKHWFCDDCKQK